MSDQSTTISAVSEWIKCCKEFSNEYDVLCELTEKKLDKILKCDELLNDIPCDITQEEILSKVIFGFCYLINALCEHRNPGFSKITWL